MNSIDKLIKDVKSVEDAKNIMRILADYINKLEFELEKMDDFADRQMELNKSIVDTMGQLRKVASI